MASVHILSYSTEAYSGNVGFRVTCALSVLIFVYRARLNKAVEKLISFRYEQSDKCGDDFFFHMLSSQVSPSAYMLTSPNIYICQGENLTAEHIQQNVLEMLIAGTDTSSVSMFYTLLLLAEHQALQDTIVKEELSVKNAHDQGICLATIAPR